MPTYLPTSTSSPARPWRIGIEASSGLLPGIWNVRFWGASALSGDTSVAGQILKVMEAEDDAVLSTNLGYGTPVGSASAVGMVLPMEMEELELDGTEQLTFIGWGVGGTDGDEWGCFVRLEKVGDNN